MTLFTQQATKHYAEQPWFVLNAASGFTLCPSAHPAVSHYYSFMVDINVEATYAVPDGCVDLIFDTNEESASAAICGTTLEASDALFKPEHRYFGVRFKLGMLPEFLNVRANEVINQTIDLGDTTITAHALIETMASCPSFAKRVEFFETILSKAASFEPSALTQFSLQQLIQHQGNMRMESLEQLTGYSLRTIQRQFKQDIGLPPKVFGRIIRCQAALHSLHKLNGVSYSDLAFSLGFSDQPHFLREFKKLVSTTPLAYQDTIRASGYNDKISLVANISQDNKGSIPTSKNFHQDDKS
ncbi:AraC family transcriptional regulator [Maribrevibacterium harenarium]|uniref:AraC family transcriptional regulator n=1 Tax=Maribrevibacterium harenarium TaxID=2589817 RepID=A0A501X1U4_9GAMM|nr:helix-turn-helix domain-containing protein [Maribrevibacterium harenarium]TPE54433.1 AraC family transcriptional regulator [Maribrevibacterium harenarium]